MNPFESLGVEAKIVKAITELGFVDPTPIQEKAIPVLLTGKTDIVALAQTGTGKTAAFGIPIIQNIDLNAKTTEALILCPTRELCVQISKDLKEYSKYINGFNVVAIYGGASIDNQIREIKRGAHIIVGTPGRMVDMIDRRAISLKNVSQVVLDEADEMLNMGFQEDLKSILSDTPKNKTTWLFSATMSKEVANIAKGYMNTPQEITVGNRNQGAEKIEHVYYVIHEREKYAALKRILDFNPGIFAIVFCRTKIETQKIADHLIKDGYDADALHGDLSQSQRDHVMKRYRNRSLQILVATDVAARGIDVDNVTHVVNYNIPDELESYTHRSGRTARAGKSGVSIVLVNGREVGKVRILERITGKKFIKSQVPGGYEVCGKQLLHLIKKIHDVPVSEKEIESYLPVAYEELGDLSKEELIKRMVSVEFNRFLEYYRNAPDLNLSQSESGRSSSFSGSESKTSKRLFINLGEMDGLNKEKLKFFLSEIAGVDPKMFGSVDVKSSFSFVEIDNNGVDLILAAVKKEKYNNRPVRAELAGNRSDKPARREGGYSRSSSSSYEGKPKYPRSSDRDGGSKRGFRPRRER